MNSRMFRRTALCAAPAAGAATANNLVITNVTIEGRDAWEHVTLAGARCARRRPAMLL
jgi:hypothetical protein